MTKGEIGDIIIKLSNERAEKKKEKNFFEKRLDKFEGK